MLSSDMSLQVKLAQRLVEQELVIIGINLHEDMLGRDMLLQGKVGTKTC